MPKLWHVSIVYSFSLLSSSLRHGDTAGYPLTVEGRWGGFQYFPIMNKAAIIIGPQVLWDHMVSFLLSEYLGAGLQDYTASIRGHL